MEKLGYIFVECAECKTGLQTYIHIYINLDYLWLGFNFHLFIFNLISDKFVYYRSTQLPLTDSLRNLICNYLLWVCQQISEFINKSPSYKRSCHSYRFFFFWRLSQYLTYNFQCRRRESSFIFVCVPKIAFPCATDKAANSHCILIAFLIGRHSTVAALHHR